MTKLLHSNGYDDWETYESSLGLYVTTLETLELFKWIREVLDMLVVLYSSFTVPSKYWSEREHSGQFQANLHEFPILEQF